MLDLQFYVKFIAIDFDVIIDIIDLLIEKRSFI